MKKGHEDLSVNFETWLQSSHTDISTPSIQSVLHLAADGATIPFMARYRKEQTGNLNEVAIEAILEGKEKWDHIVDRQKFILGEIDKQKKLTPELKEKIQTTFKLELLEDLFLPYKQHRKTKAAVAKEAGLEPLADWIWNCGHGTETPHPGQTLEIWSLTFRNEPKEIKTGEDAVAGAQDILIERLAHMQDLRQLVRTQILEKGVVKTVKAAKAKPHSKFETYFDYQEAVTSLLQPQNSHRYLAMRRGWIEEELSLNIGAPKDDTEFEASMLQAFEAAACTVSDSPGVVVLHKAARMAYKVYVYSSIENETHKTLREVADKVAIDVFAENLRKLLLASPYGAKAVLGIDPGLRTGCKVAVVDHSGKYIASTVMYLNSESDKTKAKTLIGEVVKNGNITAVAVGNGTAGRETETFVRQALKDQNVLIPVVMVSEAGASIYSASEVAREEFPDLDLTVRGAISIARRLQDPLAELVKVDPKSIGVGQYQHDVSANNLKRSLSHVVEFCVNQVGVNVNTASYHLLAYVSGIGPSVAKAIVEHRGQKGLFKSREELLEISHLSKKVFQQAAGFLRVPNSENPLDNTGVHPENYSKVEAAATRLGKQIKDLVGSTGANLLKKDTNFKDEVGEFTFEDLLKELEKPGRDPREEFVPMQFREDIFAIKDLKEGMVCPGIVTNVTNFGAFVDVGVHQDGLVHISQISDKFVKDPKEVVHPGDRVEVRVLEVNLDKNQISFSMKNLAKSSATKGSKKSQAAASSSLETSSPIQPKPSIHPKEPRQQQPSLAIQPRQPHQKSPIAPVTPGSRPLPGKGPREMKKPKEAFNNPFGGLASLRNSLKRS